MINARTWLSAWIVTAAVLSGCTGDDLIAPPAPGALSYNALSAGYYHTCGLSDGRAYCWGGNEFGTLGDGTRTSRSAPTPVAGGLRFTTLDAGAGHTCALTSAGKAWCWGQNDEGQSGDGTFAARDVPVAVIGGLTFRTISAGHAHSCGITTDARAFCWGDDSRGQLGNGETGNGGKSASPVEVLFDGELASIHAGYYQTCAIAHDGAAYCWGLNDQGQNGNESTDDVDVPIAVAGGLEFQAIAPGDRFVCGVASEDVWCWGANRAGELGSFGAPSSVPVRIDLEHAISGRLTTSMGASTIAVPAFACAIGSRDLYCWGGAAPPLLTQSSPVQTAPALSFSAVTAGSQHLCALDPAGYARCGGANGSGQLGDGTHMSRATLVAVVRSGG